MKGIVGPDALVNLRRGGGPPLVIGHRGAAAVAPENTLEALQAAVDAGAHLVEFDIGPDLRLAHSQHEMPEASVSLDAALEFLRAHSLGVQLDLKLPGYETDVIAALRRHGLEERAAGLDRLRGHLAAAGRTRTGPAAGDRLPAGPVRGRARPVAGGTDAASEPSRSAR